MHAGTAVVQTAQSSSRTITFSPTLQNSALVLLIETYGNGFLGYSQQCTDNLGQQWVAQFGGWGPGQSVYIPGPTANTAGVTSVTCQGFHAWYYNFLMVFYELSGVSSPTPVITQDWVPYNASGGTCQSDPNPSGDLTILAMLFAYWDPNPSALDYGAGTIAGPLARSDSGGVSLVYASAYVNSPNAIASMSVTPMGLTSLTFLKVRYSGAPLQVSATLSDWPGDTVNTDDPAFASGAHVPLGSTFKVRLRKQNSDGTFTGIPASFQLDTVAFSGPHDTGTLFPNNIALTYAQPANDAGSFQAVHLGTARLTITPNDTSISPVTLSVSVEKPLSVGSQHPEVDNMVISISDRKGILPQYLKGQMWHESGHNFNPKAYRYEPLADWVGDYKVISRGRDYRATTRPYSDYRMATLKDCQDDALPAGNLLLEADVTPRSLYQVCTIPLDPQVMCHQLSDADQYVWAWDIIRWNRTANWKKWNPVNYARVEAAFQSGDSCGYLWTAQTGLAASYGMMQVTYVTAIDTLHWSGTDSGAKNPSYLFDTAENLAVHGGSVDLGAEFIRRKLQETHAADAQNPQFDSETDLQHMFEDGWAKYNKQKEYPTWILNASANFPPIPKIVPVLGGSQ